MHCFYITKGRRRTAWLWLLAHFNLTYKHARTGITWRVSAVPSGFGRNVSEINTFHWAFWGNSCLSIRPQSLAQDSNPVNCSTSVKQQAPATNEGTVYFLVFLETFILPLSFDSKDVDRLKMYHQVRIYTLVGWYGPLCIEGHT